MNWSQARCRKGFVKPTRISACLPAIAILMAGCGGEKKAVNAASPPPAASVVVRPLFTKNGAALHRIDGADGRHRLGRYPRPREGLSARRRITPRAPWSRRGRYSSPLIKREYDAQLMQAKAQLAKAQADLAQAQDRTVVDIAEANLNIALAQLNKTNQDVKRLKPLAEQRAVPQQDYDDALAAQQAAQ